MQNSVSLVKPIPRVITHGTNAEVIPANPSCVLGWLAHPFVGQAEHLG
jgi:hypothetical protein